MTKKTRRMLEILPGFVSWNMILFPIWGGYFIPEVTAYYILAFIVYSVYRGFTLTVAVVLSHFRMRASERVDWMQEVRGFGDWHRVRHLILLVVANEPAEVYEKTIQALTEQTVPGKSIALVLGTEERYPQAAIEGEKLRKKYGRHFGEFLITVHPANIPGEVKGKSSNENWACREAKKVLIDEKGWEMEYCTVTSNDADAIVHKQYLACLTYKFLDDPNRYERFWQPAIVFYKNIWRLPAATRVVNTLAGLMNLGSLSRKDKLVNFSNYTTTLTMLHKVDYWDPDIIPEDYRIFFKAFFALDGRVEVEPIYLPSLGDAPESTSVWKTFVNDYQQKKRWAWGVSDVPVFIEMYLKNYRTAFLNKTLRMAKVLEHHFLWPVNWFIITIGASLASLINPNFQRTTLGFILPRTASWLMSTTLIFLLVLLIIDWRWKSAYPRETSRLRVWLAPFEFILMPIVGFFFAALPGLDAHTRLMLGRYLEYRITEKKV